MEATPQNAVTKCFDIILALRDEDGRSMNWHTLREWCVRNGGCCARNCRCCDEPLYKGWNVLRDRDSGQVVEGTERYFKVFGHCSAESACCVAENWHL
jgi:hypothetical protein